MTTRKRIAQNENAPEEDTSSGRPAANVVPIKRRRRMARPAEPSSSRKNAGPAAPRRLDTITALLSRDQGATIAELTEATGWQPHSVRGAIAGALRKRGLAIISETDGQVRRYRAPQTL